MIKICIVCILFALMIPIVGIGLLRWKKVFFKKSKNKSPSLMAVFLIFVICGSGFCGKKSSWTVKWSHDWFGPPCSYLNVFNPYTQKTTIQKNCWHMEQLSKEFDTAYDAVKFVQDVPGQCYLRPSWDECVRSFNSKSDDFVDFRIIGPTGKLFFHGIESPEDKNMYSRDERDHILEKIFDRQREEIRKIFINFSKANK